MTPDPDLIARFRRDLDRLIPGRERLGIAVSGGPDSLALLLLAAAARPGEIEAATVDHGLRAESADEAAMVADLCGDLKVPHATLRVTVAGGSSLQARAREVRYAALGDWAEQRGLAAVLSAHHADDQAETLLMRLARGAGLAGLAGVRRLRLLRQDVKLARPLLDWRKSELLEVARSAGLRPLDDPANRDPRHDRTRVRELLEEQHWLDAGRLASSAGHLADAEEALAHATERLFAERTLRESGGLLLQASDLPREFQRRLLLLAFSELGGADPRGPDLDRALATLVRSATCTLGGLKLEGGPRWRLSPAPPRH